VPKMQKARFSGEPYITGPYDPNVKLFGQTSSLSF
jgi:hypothetical protein